MEIILRWRLAQTTKRSLTPSCEAEKSDQKLVESLAAFRMSYDVTLYHRDFLKRAIESNLGDWTGADPVPEEAKRALLAVAEGAGFVRCPADEAFNDFARQEGFTPGAELILDTPALLAQLMIFDGEMAFSIPYGPRSTASVDLCIQIARRVAQEQRLGFYDPQVGEAIYEDDD